MKTAYVHQQAVSTDDLLRIGTSIDMDQQTLVKELQVLRERMEAIRAEEHQKQRIQDVLQSVVPNVYDVQHLAEVCVRLVELRTELAYLTRLVQNTS